MQDHGLFQAICRVNRLDSEDKDFGYRIKKSGFKNYISADCAVAHYHSQKGRSIHETYKYHRTRIRFVLKCFSGKTIIVAALSWLFSVITFYLYFPFKLLLFLLTGRALAKENILGGFLITKAFYKNIVSYNQIKASRFINFLDSEGMKQYVLYINTAKDEE